jgi:hypothetical protein
VEAATPRLKTRTEEIGFPFASLTNGTDSVKHIQLPKALLNSIQADADVSTVTL